MLRIIREVKPAWVVGENVAGLLSMDGGRVLAEILADMENAGYSTEVYIIPAIAVGAPHRRDRLWIVAHSERKQSSERRHPEMQRGWPAEAEQIRVGHWHTSHPDSGGSKKSGLQQPNVFAKPNIRPNADANSAGREERDTPAKPGFAGFGSGEVTEPSAHPDNDTTTRQRQYGGGVLPFAESAGFNGCHWQEHWHEVATRICGMVNGFPGGVDGITEIPAKKNTGKASRLEALGNAIVPQVAYQIFKAINEHEPD